MAPELSKGPNIWLHTTCSGSWTGRRDPISDCTLPVVVPELEDEKTLHGVHTEAKRLKRLNIYRKILANMGVQLRYIEGYFWYSSLNRYETPLSIKPCMSCMTQISPPYDRYTGKSETPEAHVTPNTPNTLFWKPPIILVFSQRCHWHIAENTFMYDFDMWTCLAWYTFPIRTIGILGNVYHLEPKSPPHVPFCDLICEYVLHGPHFPSVR